MSLYSIFITIFIFSILLYYIILQLTMISYYYFLDFFIFSIDISFIHYYTSVIT